jgi:hypothetical protein
MRLRGGQTGSEGQRRRRVWRCDVSEAEMTRRWEIM